MADESVMNQYLYDGADMVAEKDGSGNVVAWYVHGPGIDEPLARIDASSGAVRYYHADGLGSIVALTDEAGAATTRYSYGPYGETVASGEAVAQPFRYTGREWDGETGLYFYRARYYSPEMGRFISEDPIGFAGGINFYAYVGNDPVNATDPSGLLSPGHHRDITEAAAIAAGFPPSVAAAIAEAVVAMDSGTQGEDASDTNIHAMAGLVVFSSRPLPVIC